MLRRMKEMWIILAVDVIMMMKSMILMVVGPRKSCGLISLMAHGLYIMIEDDND